jgi:hypothetical protein
MMQRPGNPKTDEVKPLPVGDFVRLFFRLERTYRFVGKLHPFPRYRQSDKKASCQARSDATGFKDAFTGHEPHNALIFQGFGSG